MQSREVDTLLLLLGLLSRLPKIRSGALSGTGGGLGRLLVGARTAVTHLASNRGALGVSATVSVTRVGVEVEGCVNGLGSSISSVAVSITFSIVAGVGGLFLRSSTRSLSSSIS